MSPMDRPEFVAGVAKLFAAYGKVLSEDQADAYWEYLNDMSLDEALEGVKAAGRTGGRYVPSVGQIRELIAADGPAILDTRRDYSQPPLCEICEDTGWEPTKIPHPCGYDVPAVRPCSCARGHRRRLVMDRARTHKGAA